MDVIEAGKQLVQRAKLNGNLGNVVAPDQMAELCGELELTVPAWFIELFTTVPLAGLELGWQADEPDAEYDGIAWMEWSDADNIRSESLECYPGLAILKSGYVNVASCSMGSGDPYFIGVSDGDDPPVYQIYHDVSDKAEVILEKGRRMVAPKLSTFFRDAILHSN